MRVSQAEPRQGWSAFPCRGLELSATMTYLVADACADPARHITRTTHVGPFLFSLITSYSSVFSLAISTLLLHKLHTSIVITNPPLSWMYVLLSATDKLNDNLARPAEADDNG